MLLDIVKFRAYHVYFLVIGIGVSIGAIYDNMALTGIATHLEDPYFGIGYSLGVTTFYGGILLIFYYLCVLYYRKKTHSKSYI